MPPQPSAGTESRHRARIPSSPQGTPQDDPSGRRVGQWTNVSDEVVLQRARPDREGPNAAPQPVEVTPSGETGDSSAGNLLDAYRQYRLSFLSVHGFDGMPIAWGREPFRPRPRDFIATIKFRPAKVCELPAHEDVKKSMQWLNNGFISGGGPLGGAGRCCICEPSAGDSPPRTLASQAPEILRFSPTPEICRAFLR